MDFTDIIKTVAPWIGTALGGPLGGMALTAAANALGLPAATTDALKQLVSGATPDQLLALKQADNNFALQMKTLDIQSVDQLAALQVENTKDARAMQVSTRSVVPPILATVVTVGFLGLLGGIAAGYLNIQDSPTLQILIGMLATAWASIINYYFGSSAGSARKDELAAGAQPEAAAIKPAKF